MQAGDITLVTGGCKGTAPHQRVTEAVIKRTQSRATNVQLAGISAPLVTCHLQQHLAVCRSSRSTLGDMYYSDTLRELAFLQ